MNQNYDSPPLPVIPNKVRNLVFLLRISRYARNYKGGEGLEITRGR